MIRSLKNLLFPKTINVVTGDTSYKPPFHIRWFQFKESIPRDIYRFKRTLRTPICWSLGHATYESTYWNYHRIYCKRCNYMKSLWESPNVKR